MPYALCSMRLIIFALTERKKLIYIHTYFSSGKKRMSPFPYRLGVHVSIAGGIEKAADRARELGCSAMQIFSRNPRGWRASPFPLPMVRAFREKVKQFNLDPVVVHAPYLLNLASGNRELHRRSAKELSEDLKRAEQLGARYAVTHLGSAGEQGPGTGRNRVVQALKRILEQGFEGTLLLENSAGGGNRVGASFEEVAQIMGGAGDDPRVGFCFDSCHGFAAGYDFRSPEQCWKLVKELDRTIGLERLKLIHLNDCSGALGSHRDRHQHIGKGEIGLTGFRSFLGQEALRKIPMILETPKEGPRDDRNNLARIRALLESGAGGNRNKPLRPIDQGKG
jgi:deoxyribonuclease-4